MHRPIFRRGLRAKYTAATRPAFTDSSPALTNLELAINIIERLADEWDWPPSAAAVVASGDAKIRSLRNSVHLLNVVALLAAVLGACAVLTCSVPNAHLVACAHLYLSIIYKIERNNGVSARHLLKVFVEAPYIARKSMLRDLWDHFFLPNLLHLKIWYTKEVEIIRGWGLEDGNQSIKGLRSGYNDPMNRCENLSVRFVLQGMA
uniref:Putative E3 ubiquitin-protein ligase LIN N-terminal domain-containing protein n=1 Tax=Ananas comosus var. bracteatus TaxID=296719 RepID=A0A6V7PXK6_ANACO|nr:unnamed protein product [Ananas comosus var. bracteatus]